MKDRVTTNREYDRLLDQAVESDCVVRVMHDLCKSDLFFLLTRMLDRDDADRDWIFERCREFESEPDGWLDAWARGHYKSTIITFAGTIQEILRNPEITIGIFSHTKPNAKTFLRQIKTELESNEKLKHVFSDVLYKNPKKSAPKWNEDEGLVVKRKGNPKEATLEAWGVVEGQPTGRHFDLMVYDDMVDEDSVGTPEMILKTTKRWELSTNLLSEHGRDRVVGTFYHANDTYQTMIKRGYQVRLHPCTHNGKADGKPVLLTEEQIIAKRKKMGPYTFGCQMLLDPTADKAQGFLPDWLLFWRPTDTSFLNLALLVDPASEKRKTNDYTSMWVLGLGDDGNTYVVDGLRDRLNLTQRANAVFQFHNDYDIRFTGYEKYGMMADIEHIRFLMNERNYRFHITPLGGNVPKKDRIKTLVPDFENGRLYLPERLMKTDYQGRTYDLIRVFIDDEYSFFPVCSHDDMLDCLARKNDPDFKLTHPRRSRPKRPMTMAQRDWAQVEGRGRSRARVMDDLSDDRTLH